jgi:hypothetical protein
MKTRVSQFLVVCLLLALPKLASAQQLAIGTMSTAGADCSIQSRCIEWLMEGVVSATVYLDVGTSGTFNWQANLYAVDETKWFNVADDVNSLETATADGVYRFSNSGYKRMRVRPSAINGNATAVVETGMASFRSSIGALAKTSNSTAATVGNASAQALASNAIRKALVAVNTSNNTISCAVGQTAVLYSGITLAPLASWYMGPDTLETGAVNCIASAAGSNLSLKELQ